MPYGEGNGLIQAGITKDVRMLYPPIAHEPASKTGLKHEAGTILLANAGARHRAQRLLHLSRCGSTRSPSATTSPPSAGWSRGWTW